MHFGLFFLLKHSLLSWWSVNDVSEITKTKAKNPLSPKGNMTI